jgi:hypothetical protein
MKEGDIVMLFGNPITNTHPIGQAKLVTKLSDYGKSLENWKVEYLDDEGHFYNCLIKKEDGESK